MKGGLTVWDEAVQRHVDVSKPKMATGVILNILDSVELELGGRGSVGIVVTQPGGYNGTAAVEVSQDGGATWLSVRFEDLAPLDPAVSVLDSITSTVMAAGVAYLSVRPVGARPTFE